MARLNLKRPERTEVELSAGKLSLRPLSALDISEMVKHFDLETVELATRIINHVQAGKPIADLLFDASMFVGLINEIPAVATYAINMSAGGDNEDLEAIRELSAEDFATASMAVLSVSLERIGGLGKLLDLVTDLVDKTNQVYREEVLKNGATLTSSQSGEQSHS